MLLGGCIRMLWYLIERMGMGDRGSDEGGRLI